LEKHVKRKPRNRLWG